MNCSIHHLEDFLVKLYQAGENAHLMVCGDFNACIGEVNILIDDYNYLFGDGVCGDNTRKPQNKNTNQFGKILINFCSTFHCISWNGNHSGDLDRCFTFISDQGNSVIDHCVVSSDFVSKSDMHFEVGSRVETSHMPLNISIKSKQSEPEKGVERTIREFS